MDGVIRFAEYIRVSGAGQAERETQRVQREALLRLRDRRPGVIIAGNGPHGAFEDIAISGTKGEDERPGWAAVMGLLRSGQIEELRVHAIDRCTRSDRPTAWAQLAEDFADSNGVLVETSGAITDLRGKQGFEVMLLIFKAFGAAEERRRITKRFLDGRREAANAKDARGGWGGVAFAYKYDKKVGYVIDDAPVDSNWTRVRLIQRVFDLGLSHAARHIAKLFTAEGIPTPSGESVWSEGTIHAWLKNSTYKGLLLGRLPPEVDERGQPREAPDGVGVEEDEDGVHWHYTVQVEPIVEPTVWDRVQVARLARKNERPDDYVEARPVFRYLTYCGGCGGKMMMLNRANRGVRYPTYTCRTKECDHRRSFRMGAIDAIAWHTIVERLCSSDLLTEPSQAGSHDEAAVARARATAAIDAAEAEIDSLFRRFGGKAPALRDAMEKRCEELSEQVEHHRLVLRRADDMDAQRAAFHERAAVARSHVEALRATLESEITVERKRELAKLLLGGGAGRLIIHPLPDGRARLEIESDLLASTGRLPIEEGQQDYVPDGPSAAIRSLRTAAESSATSTSAARSPRRTRA